MEQWNNVELSNLSKKSYTLNHEFHLPSQKKPENGSDVDSSSSAPNSNETEVKSENSDVLQPGSDIKPKVNLDDVESLAQRLYGITTSQITELIAYDDRNYLIIEDRNIKNPIIVSHCPDGYVLKILNAHDSKKPNFIEAQNELLIFLSEQKIGCPLPITNVNGKYYSVENINGTNYITRLLQYIPGKIFHEVDKTNFLVYQSGEFLAKIDRALKNFKHDAYDAHKTVWMLQSVPQLREFTYTLENPIRKALVEEIIACFETEVLSKLDSLETQIIHGDYNEQNIIVEKPKDHKDYKVVGVIDFGDTSKSPLIFEVGIGMTYVMLQGKSLESGGIFLAGYTSVNPIRPEEKGLLKYCVAARLAQSLTMGAYTHTVNPSNEYVLVTQEGGWKLIEELWRDQFSIVDELWQTTADKYLTQSTK